MCVYGGVAGSASQIFVLTVGDVLVRACVTVFLSQTKIDYVDQVTLLAQPHQEVVWLHISMNEVLGVDIFNAADLERRAGNKSSANTMIKKLLKTLFREHLLPCTSLHLYTVTSDRA